jgi:hypothetical protein
MAFTPEELEFLHTTLEDRAEVCADEGDYSEAGRINALVTDAPVIPGGDAEWLVEYLQGWDDEPAAVTLRAKLAALIQAYRDLDNFYLGIDEDNEDTPEILAEQERLFGLIGGLNGDCRR